MKKTSNILKTSSFLSVGVLILMVPTLIWSFGKARTASENDILATSIQSAFFEQAALRDKYLLYRETRAKNEWYVRTAAANLLIQKAAVRFGNSDDRIIVEEMRRSFNDTRDIFSRLVRNSEMMKGPGSDVHIRQELEKRLISQILLRASNLQGTAKRLQNKTQGGLESTYQRSITLTSLFVVLAVFVSLLNYWLVNSSLRRRRQAEEALEKEAALNKAFLDTVRAVVLIQDKDARILYFNLFSEELSGYSSAEILGKTVWDLLLPPEDMEPVRQAWQMLMAKHEIKYFENFWKTKSGELRRLAWTSSAILDNTGEPEYIIGVAFDITERTRMEEALRESEKRYRTLFNQARDGIVIVDPVDGRIVDLNKSFADMHGHVLAEMKQLNLRDLDTPETAELIQDRIKRILAGESLHFEVEHYHKEGHVIPLDVVANRIKLNGKELILSFHRDLSELKQFIRELAVARDAADAANGAKSDFLANMSHEIRTPMSGIMGMAELLEETELSDIQKEYLEAIQISANSLLTVISDILDISKIEAGRIDLELIPFSLRNTIDDTLKAQASLARSKGLDLVTEIASGIPDGLTGDQYRLKQILLNLVSNAIKFTEKGSITVSATLIEDHGDSALFRLSVADTGSGINPKAIAKIFAPFIQADSSTTRKHGGTGLGLSISTRLAELMGGRIRVESCENIGSTFHIELPFIVNSADVEGSSVIDQPFAWQGPPLHILLAEDHEINRRFTMEILQKMGHILALARDGREAVETWEKGGTDVILMDVQMPVLDGIEATRIIREREKASGGHTPIIALTAHALMEDRENLLKCGFDGYVSKPVAFEVLISEIRKCSTGADHAGFGI